ncbi:hypothetical protein D3C72_1444350 [compost metagenome]
MQGDRAFDLRHEVERAFDAHAVVAHGRVHARVRGGQVGQLAAEAEAQRADLAGAGRVRAQRLHARRDVGHAGFDVELLEEAEGALPVFGRVAQIDAGLHAPEQVGREHHVAFLRIEVGHLAHVGIDAEDLLAQHDAGAAPRGRQGQVAAKGLGAVAGGNVDGVAHRFVS